MEESSVVIVASVTLGTLLILNAVDILHTLSADVFAVVAGEMYTHWWWSGWLFQYRSC